jgi:radical SAM protein with 4Fe4S-binding SPASM domain
MKNVQPANGGISVEGVAGGRPTSCNMISWLLIPESACWLMVILMSELPLRTIYWYVTAACNQHCKHCWLNAGAQRGQELEEEQLMKIFRELIDMGLEHVKVTGGEPFLRWDRIKNILKFLIEHDIQIRIETNGTLLCGENKNEILALLRDEHILRVAVSLDSHMSEVHDHFREMDGAFKKTVGGITALNQNGIPFSIVTVLHEKNCSSIEDVIDFVEHLNPHHHLIDLIIPEGRSKKNAQYQLSPEFYVKTLPSLIRRVKEKKGKNVIFNFPFVFSPLHVDFKSCTVGRDLCGLLPNGDLAVCGAGLNRRELAVGNTLEDDIEDIWMNSPAFLTLRKKASEIKGICGNCMFIKHCLGHCRAFAYSESGQLDAPYPICQILYEQGIFPQKYMIEVEKDCSMK